VVDNIQPIDVRHVQIEQQQIIILSFQGSYCGKAADGKRGMQTGSGEDYLQAFADARVIIDDQHLDRFVIRAATAVFYVKYTHRLLGLLFNCKARQQDLEFCADPLA